MKAERVNICYFTINYQQVNVIITVAELMTIIKTNMNKTNDIPSNYMPIFPAGVDRLQSSRQKRIHTRNEREKGQCSLLPYKKKKNTI